LRRCRTNTIREWLVQRPVRVAAKTEIFYTVHIAQKGENNESYFKDGLYWFRFLFLDGLPDRQIGNGHSRRTASEYFGGRESDGRWNNRSC
jgi:hypothetical protein